MANQTPHIYSVTELTRQIKAHLEACFPAVWVEGEISNLRPAQSGHLYFTLKDANAALSAVMFRNTAGRLTFRPNDGLHVLAFGQISVYEKSGQYQLIVEQLMPKGLGALQLAFEQLKQKLANEGLFDPARKKPLPVLPRRIGLVTSPTGAAVRDFLRIIGQRFPNIHIIINPVRVQGEGAAQEIAAAIDEFNAMRCVDVIVITRGGGSLEDLWPFNEEIVARAIARSRLPTISAVGHEIDFTIADFVADLRAPTPSAAAQMVIPAKADLLTRLAELQRHLDKDLKNCLLQARQRLQRCTPPHPIKTIQTYQQRLDELATQLAKSCRRICQQHRNRLANLRLPPPQKLLQLTRNRLTQATTRLDLLSPLATLKRGYSITRTSDGTIVRSIRQTHKGQRLRTLVADGEFESRVL
ncbi:MAG: exodeoxyribonuclease VII large subunit [Verrucomicrobiae bacterium]|nr:exodeoxyribonuclease VII large subunit [Verrucomicrobiae bacterium]